MQGKELLGANKAVHFEMSALSHLIYKLSSSPQRALQLITTNVDGAAQLSHLLRSRSVSIFTPFKTKITCMVDIAPLCITMAIMVTVTFSVLSVVERASPFFEIKQPFAEKHPYNMDFGSVDELIEREKGET